MRFVMKQITPGKAGGGGASDLTRYVARSKLDPAREGRSARALFTRAADHLSPGQARAWLSITGGAWANRDALHYVLSLSEAREYELLGADEPERQQALRLSLRQALATAFRQMGLSNMRWAAGLHRNTAHPHLHLLLNKNAVSQQTGDLVYVPRLAREALPHNVTQPDGSKHFQPGFLLAVFAAQMDARQRERARWLEFTSPWQRAGFTRAVLAPEALGARAPAPAEHLAGQWLRAELGLLPPSAKDTLPALRAALTHLDQEALAQGQPVPAAFLSNEDLRAVLLAQSVFWRVTPHRANPLPDTLPARVLAPATTLEFPHSPPSRATLRREG